MEKIKRYEIIKKDSSMSLEVCVNDYIKNGWYPYGSPFNAFDSNHKLALLSSCGEI